MATATDTPTVALDLTQQRPIPPLRWAKSGRVFFLCFALLALTACASILLGARSIPLPILLETLSGTPNNQAEVAVIAARITRTLVGIVAGAALGVAGTGMQGLTRNPLADPGIFGVNSGAALGIVVAVVVFGIGEPQLYLWFAFLGAAVAAMIVYALGQRGSKVGSPMTVAITGAALSAGLLSILMAILVTQRDAMTLFRQWQVGSLAGRAEEQILAVAPALIIGAILVLSAGRWLNAWALGGALAQGLGYRHVRVQLVTGGGIVLLCAGATALAGPIAFLGLLVPHLLRPFVGTNYRHLLPAALIAAPTLLLVADTAGRFVLPPGEVPAGVMTALLGGPLFIALARRGRAAAL